MQRGIVGFGLEMIRVSNIYSDENMFCLNPFYKKGQLIYNRNHKNFLWYDSPDDWDFLIPGKLPRGKKDQNLLEKTELANAIETEKQWRPRDA